MEQPYHTNTGVLAEDESYSLKKELKNVGNTIIYALGFWRILLVAAVIGFGAGIIYTWMKTVEYTARTTFIVEESKMGGGGIASALAGSIGIDIGSLTGSSSGMLAGDNVQELVKSHKLIRKTLLTAYDSANSKSSLADVYAESMGLKEKWVKSRKVGRQISFPIGALTMGRTEDSLLQKIIEEILKSSLSITKTDKKLSFFELSIAVRDERLGTLFSQRLLKTTADFYIDTKTKRLSTNVMRLQAKADSLAYSLNRKTYATADLGKTLLDANPAYTSGEATAEISTRDKYMQATVYAEIVKNLEISRTALIQETPTIQVVDDPEVPLKDNKTRWWLAAMVGAFIAAFFTGIGIITVKK